MTEHDVINVVTNTNNATVLPRIAAIESDVGEVKRNLKRFIGDGNGGGDGIYGRKEKEKEERLERMEDRMGEMAVSIAALTTEKAVREGTKVALDEKAVASNRKTNIIIALVSVGLAAIMTALGLLTYHYTHHADILSNRNPVVAQYDSSIPQR